MALRSALIGAGTASTGLMSMKTSVLKGFFTEFPYAAEQAAQAGR